MLRGLRASGLLSAARGSGGGYRFTGNVKRVTLMDVIERFEAIGAAARRRAPRLAEQKALEEVLAEIDEIARATFRSITLDTMLKLVARRAPPPTGGLGRQS